MAAGLKSAIHEVLKVWNDNVKANDINEEYIIDVRSRKKNYYLTKTKTYTQDISELLFISRTTLEGTENTDAPKTRDLLLWRKEIQVPSKVQNTSKHIVRSNIEDNLYKYFLHECIGTFGQTCEQLILSQDYAPYDIVKDRLMSHESFKDHVVEATENGAYYEIGDQFDVFNQLEGGWAVYTAHDIGKTNGGIAKLDFTKCKLVQETAQKIELYTPPIPKIQLLK